ncbi:unnamed protein product [marine sediment metagenome]|uniref:Uncharacterized protein n=1 Tax=marine sediment metagenome TaxID=412755 RepID=X1UJJ6_9ZZZZ
MMVVNLLQLARNMDLYLLDPYKDDIDFFAKPRHHTSSNNNNVW